MNKWIGIGREVKDPDVRATSEGTAIARFTLAVDRKFKKEGDQSADFISCICFGKTAEFIEKYTSKGTKLAVEGRIQTGSYEKDGHKVYTTDIVVESVEFAESKKTAETPAATPSDVGDGFTNIPDNLESELPFV